MTGRGTGSRERFIMPLYVMRMVVMCYPFSAPTPLWVNMLQMSDAIYDGDVLRFASLV